MAYSVLSRNGEETFNKFTSPDPDQDNLRGGSSHGYIPSYVKQIKSIGAIVLKVNAYQNALPSHSPPGVRAMIS